MLKNTTNNFHFFLNLKKIFVAESLFMAVDNVFGSTGCHWIASTDVMVFASVSYKKLRLFQFLPSILFHCSVLVYYLRSKSKARIEMVKLLKQMLYVEAKDKAFLLANITRVTQNNGMLCWFAFNLLKNFYQFFLQFFFENLEWLLDDCVKQPFLRPPNRTIDKYTIRPFASNSNRKISQPNFGELRKNGTTTHFASSDRITNGNAVAATEADHHSIT